MTRFEQFQQNVQRWATERGIYEHSTALAQALKAVSEVGELCDAVIKNDRDALVDAIGDTAVCLVNLGAMLQAPVVLNDKQYAYTLHEHAADVAQTVGDIAGCFYAQCHEFVSAHITEALAALRMTARVAELDFDDCCESAWQTIKDRKGRMVAGGAFVKEGEADPKLVAAVNLQGLERCDAEGCSNSRMLFSRSCPEHQSHD